MVASDTTKKGNCGIGLIFLFSRKKHIFLLENWLGYFVLHFSITVDHPLAQLCQKHYIFLKEKEKKRDLSVGVFATKDLLLSRTRKKKMTGIADTKKK